MNEMFPFEHSNFGGFLYEYGSKGFESEEGRNSVKPAHLYGKESRGEKGGTDSFSSDFGFYLEKSAEDGLLFSNYQQEHQQHSVSDFGILDDLYLDMVSLPFQSSLEDTTKVSSFHAENMLLDEPKNEKPCATPLASLLGILNNYGSGFRQLNLEKIKVPSSGTACTKPEPKVGGQKLSIENVLRLAGEKFIQFSSQGVDDLSVFSHPFGSSFLGLSDDETGDVELVQNLLASAEKVGQQQYDRANKLLCQCYELSSDTGNPVQRLVYYFSEALREKIDKETGRTTETSLGEKQLLDLQEAIACPNLAALITFHQQTPFSQVSIFPGMQAIIERVAEAKKVHLIELEIKSGLQCTILMQALAGRSECPLKLLKITAVGTKARSTIEETGERLMSFAQSINLPFSFKVVMVSDFLNLHEDLFKLEEEETVAINAPYCLWPMLARPDRLERLMRVLRRVNPCVMAVIEVEANHNSPVFVNRFIEALFFFGAYFDCLEDCMDRNDPNRKMSESGYFSSTIQNIIAAEGEERIMRHVNISVWRAFFARFGMKEEELSTSSLYQASLVVKNFACGSSCTLDMDGNCLIIGWKGTPIQSVSAWKFV
ncbi:DELLA protein RGL2-like [Actinidia eriantha]|uniref:DELLA protein RGL2-like n=1 Tax=Actinidia eriantha TaxID=165200 RepID=UPI002585997D|nr:DELLA protein RGL2-like [Actinidia eriantha]